MVFVTRQDLHRKREKEMLRLEIENIKRTSPAEKQEKRIKKWGMYYEKTTSDYLFSFFWNFRNSPKNNSAGNWTFSSYDEAGFGGGYAYSGA